MNLPPYAKYKPSGVEWLGDVPEHWEVKPLKRELRRSASGGGLIKGEMASEPGDGLFQGFSASGPDVWVDEAHYSEPGVVLSAVGARCGKAFKADGQWTAVANTHVFLPEVGRSRDYLWYLLNNEEFWEKGGTAQPYVRVPATLNRAFVFAPPAEQRSIAAFLDRETGRVDRLVAKKRELIERLKEKRTALISRTVTRGLPPAAARAAGLPANPPLKPSALDWLGDIPKHWEVIRLKRFFKHVYRYPTYYDIQYVDEGVPEIRGEALVDGKIVELEDQRFISPETNSRFPQTILDVGDIVMSVRGTMGKIGVVGTNFKGANITANLLRLSPDERQAVPEFLSWLFRSGFFLQALDRVCPQTTIQTVTMPQLAAIELPHPPLPEQAAVAAYLDEETAKLDALVGKVEEAVERLQEYRTALITAAVTGKIDVREVARLGSD